MGKSKAMELILTGDFMSAQDAEKFGKPPTTHTSSCVDCQRLMSLMKCISMCLLTDIVLVGGFAVATGLVCRVVPEDELLNAATEMAKKIASYSQPITAMAKECVNQAFESTLREGDQQQQPTTIRLPPIVALH